MAEMIVGMLSYADQNWIGGVYYVKSMIDNLIALGKNAPKIIIICNDKNIENFNEYKKKDNCKIVKINSKFAKISRISSKLFGYSSFDPQIIRVVKKYNITVLFPVTIKSFIGINKVKKINWYPDFQHLKLPHLFNKMTIKHRNNCIKKIVNSDNILVLSSNDSYLDLKSFFKINENKKIFIQPFASSISEEEIKADSSFIYQKYSLSDKFFFIPNQLWKHKNHITAFKSIKILKDSGGEVELVCSGKASDDSYYSFLIDFINTNDLKNNIKLIGFISRYDQVQIMKESIAIIQPSLFEGWSTVVEDAKALDKKIILSNLNVHREQQPNKSTFFEPENFTKLAEIIKKIQNSPNEKTDNYKLITDLNQQRKIYGENIMKIFEK